MPHGKVQRLAPPGADEGEQLPAPIEQSESAADVPVQPSADWRKGALLNVRNCGDAYVITRWPEEYSPEREDRCIKFTNLGLCQDFVSDWYSRKSHDPRAR
ncbi:hypothetical protein [Paraburkholderia ferrariae]|uniref:hypothetical protein n=1 Tax=Paraburkholderia ferrariae TaxID=386056 RepID=UPI001FE12C97|nr:hypothetical protein [Paraburkholderia ferrariae]